MMGKARDESGDAGHIDRPAICCEDSCTETLKDIYFAEKQILRALPISSRVSPPSSRSVLRHIRVASKQELKDRTAAIDDINRDPVSALGPTG
jgi:hypothetical protein